ncbi:SusC/RagA family TonB-linked outer membrane protein [Maribellus comscasis]|uniref:SusC/RagA family TonB-linked outer membrane protein n=1 Tax=Maribellus comscasis TaxID=2681766 RepID=A0A6I6JUP7_9BACT|nr:SusC/RagA family TonB-linked outer membrane protein [Maribellus comscasis]QGY44800.1 SusC/RagA family TonB-linked outer membrane protein [Maribellus comscasis]
MKLTFLFLLMGLMQVSASVYSQTTKLTLDMRNRKVVDVLEEIERQSEFRFAYSSEYINVDRKVTVELNEKTIDEILGILFNEDRVKYVVKDRHILLYPREMEGENSLMGSQQGAVVGTVADENGQTLPGVTVLVKGTTKGTVTNIDGVFNIPAVEEGDILVFSFVGMTTQEVVVGSQRNISVTMMPDVIGIEEVVAIGYGSMKKGDVTSSISSVKSEDFIKGAVKDAAQLVQGKVAGLTITTPSGDPTEGALIMLRGQSSILGTSDPLVLVDGVPGSLESVAPEDIESIDVLKDGSASAIYGTRGTNGVIIITTKSSANNMEPTIDYTGYVSVASINRTLDFLNAEQLREKWDEGYSFTGANLQDFGASTDWLDEITRTAISHVHNLVFRGGNKNTNLTASLNYKDNQGTFIRSDNQKYTGRIDVNHTMFDGKLIANIGTIVSEQKYWTGGDGYSFNTYVYRQALIRNPTEPIKNEDGSWYERDVYFYDNPVGYIKESDGENRYRNVRFTTSLTFKPFSGFDIKGMYTRKGNSNIRGFYQTKKHVSTTKYGSEGYASRGTDNYVGNYAELTGNYRKVIGEHNFSAMVGYNYEDNMNEGFWANNKYFPTDGYTYNNLEIGNGLPKGEAGMGSYKNSNKLIALFSRVSYTFADKYLFMASVRREGSSKFGKDNKWGYFPGVSVGWRMNEEGFMQNVDWVDNLKLRAGFGITGTNVLDSYNSLSSLDYSDYFYYNGDWVRKLVPVRNDNPDLRWEKKEEINVGLDFALLNGRIGGSFDFYRRLTKDALYNYDVPTPPYLYGTITANVGEIENKGFEALINIVPVRTSNFEWNANFTYSTNKNKLVSLSNEKFQTTNDFFYPGDGYTGEPIQTTTHIVKVGEPIGNFYGLRSVDITDDGIWIIEKPDGTRVSATESSTDDRQVLGNGVPKHYLSWNNSFRYKGFDLTINMRGAFSYQILNFSRMFYENPTITYNTLNSGYDKVYGKAVLADEQRYVSYYVEDGDFWKIDNITLGYTVNLKNNNVIKNLRVYTSGLNLLTITGYKGIDPEVKQTGLAPGNDDRDKYPTTKTFTFGVNVTF